MKSTRRDFIIRAALLTIASTLMELDQKHVSDEEKDIAREAMALLVGSFPIGSEPTVDQVADRGKLAIRAWRKLNEQR